MSDRILAFFIGLFVTFTITMVISNYSLIVALTTKIDSLEVVPEQTNDITVEQEIQDDINLMTLEVLNRLESRITKLEDMVVPAAKVTITCYNSHPSQTDDTPNITAFNTTVKPGGIAVSWDLFERGFTHGVKVYLEGFGVLTVNDLMNRRFENRVDVWVPEGTKQFKYDDRLLVALAPL